MFFYRISPLDFIVQVVQFQSIRKQKKQVPLQNVAIKMFVTFREAVLLKPNIMTAILNRTNAVISPENECLKMALYKLFFFLFFFKCSIIYHNLLLLLILCNIIDFKTFFFILNILISFFFFFSPLGTDNIINYWTLCPGNCLTILFTNLAFFIKTTFLTTYV